MPNLYDEPTEVTDSVDNSISGRFVVTHPTLKYHVVSKQYLHVNGNVRIISTQYITGLR